MDSVKQSKARAYLLDSRNELPAANRLAVLQAFLPANLRFASIYVLKASAIGLLAVKYLTLSRLVLHSFTKDSSTNLQHKNSINLEKLVSCGFQVGIACRSVDILDGRHYLNLMIIVI